MFIDLNPTRFWLRSKERKTTHQFHTGESRRSFERSLRRCCAAFYKHLTPDGVNLHPKIRRARGHFKPCSKYRNSDLCFTEFTENHREGLYTGFT